MANKSLANELRELVQESRNTVGKALQAHIQTQLRIAASKGYTRKDIRVVRHHDELGYITDEAIKYAITKLYREGIDFDLLPRKEGWKFFPGAILLPEYRDSSTMREVDLYITNEVFSVKVRW